MARRQPYSHVNTSQFQDAPAEPAQETALDDGGMQITLDDLDFQAPEPSGQETPPEPQAEPRTAPDPEPEPPRPSADEEAHTRLKAQLDRAEEARRLAERRLNQIEQDHSAAQDTLQRERERARQMEIDHAGAQELAISNALLAAQREADAAESVMAQALEAQDFAAATKAQRTLTQAENDIARLKEGKHLLESQKRQLDRAPPRQERRDAPPAQAQPQTEFERIEAYIEQPAHTPRVKEYLRQHYDDLFSNGGARVNRLVSAHWDSKASGVVEGSDAYFGHLDKFMGYNQKQEPPARQPATEPRPAPRAPIPPAAPVSRGNQQTSGAPAGQPSSTSITLNAAQVAFCREAGIDPKAYARSILQMRAGAKDPSYTGPRFTGDL